MDDTPSLLKASSIASLVAGPLFLALFALLTNQEQASAAMHVDVSLIPGAVAFLLASALFGAFLAFPTCLIIGGAMNGLAGKLPLLRPTALWLTVAGGIALAIVTAFGLDLGAGSLAFVATAIACAAIVRARLHWD